MDSCRISGDPVPLSTTVPSFNHSTLVALAIVHVIDSESPTMYSPKKCLTALYSGKSLKVNRQDDRKLVLVNF